MIRATLACCVVMLVVVAGGCRMCAESYDYCGPTFTGQCDEQCDPNARAGSILSSNPGMIIEGEVITVSESEDEIPVDGELMPVPDETVQAKPKHTQVRKAHHASHWRRPRR